jgi:hypothetical protein
MADRRADNPTHGQAMRLALAAALIGVSGAAVAGVVTPPPWTQSQVGAPLPPHDEETDAVKLYSEITLTVDAKGKIHRTDREVFRILRAQGGKRAVARADFDAQRRVTQIHGWSIPADGKPYEVTEKDSVETALVGVLNGQLMGDLRSKVLRIPAAVPGSTVGYEIEQELQPYALLDDWLFQDTIPVREAHYSLELPPGWHFKATWINHAEEAVTQVGPTRWQWVVGDVKAIRPEPQMPPMRAVAGRMAVLLLPPAGREQGFQNWRELGTWYLSLARDRGTASDEIKKKVAELTASQATTLGKIQALASFVQTDIRYVAIELGIGNLQPHSAADSFAHRYGDCKDKVTLLSSMLKEIGIESYYVLVNTTRGAVTSAAPLDLDFNHVIIAIQLPPDIQDPILLATRQHTRLGRLLLFDPTDPFSPLGQIPGILQGGYGLLVAPDGGELIELPVLPSSANGIQRAAHLRLDVNGQLSGEVHEVWAGDPAARERGILAAASLETGRAKPLEALLADSFATFNLTQAALSNRLAASSPLEWTYSLEVDQYAKVSGDLMTVRPRVLGSKSPGFLETKEPRQYDIEFEGLRRDKDVFEIALPAGYKVDELPRALDEEHTFATYHSKTEVVGSTLRYSRTFELKSVTVPAAQADELKAFYRSILNDERMPAILRNVGR